jgi:hypothetical protein
MVAPGYNDLTNASQMYWSRKFKALLVKVLTGVVRSLLRGSDWYNFGRLMNKGLDGSVS